MKFPLRTDIIKKSSNIANIDNIKYFKIDKANKYKKTGTNKSKSKLINQMLISYALIIFISMTFMGVLSYFYLTQSIQVQAYTLNDKIVSQFCDSVDNLIIKNINDFSLKVIKDIKEDEYINYFYENKLEDKLIEASEFREKLEDIKASNVMLDNLGILFGNTNAIISSKFVNSGNYISDDKGNEEALQIKKNFDVYDSNCYWVAEVYDSDSNIGINTKTTDISLVRKINLNSNNPKDKGCAVFFRVNESVFYDIIRKSANDKSYNKFNNIIINDNGTIIISNDKEIIGKNVNIFEFGGKILESKESANNISFINNKEKFVASYCTSKYANWKYISVAPIKNYFDSYNFIIKTVLFTSVLACVFGILISLLFAKKISNPIRELADFCNEKYKNLNNTLNNNVLLCEEQSRDNECVIINYTLNALSKKIDEQDERFKKTLPILKANFINNLISNQITDKSEINSKIRLFDISIPFSKFIVIVMKIRMQKTENYDMTFEYDKFNFLLDIENKFNTDYCCCMSCEKDKNFIFMINFEMSEKDILKYILDNFYNKIIKMFDMFIVNVGVGTIVNDISNVYKSYDDAIKSLKYSYVFPKRMFFLLNDIVEREENTMSYNAKLVKSFDEALNTFKYNEINLQLQRIINYITNVNISYNASVELLNECVSIIGNMMNRMGMSLINLGMSEENIKSRFKKIDNIYEFELWIKDLIKNLIEFNEKIESEKSKLIVEAAKKYIQNNIKDSQLSLKSVAEELCVSESYLSRVFKKEVNMNFIDYIIDMKLECVKDCLLSGNKTIAEVSLEMGYSSPQYLTKRFVKKYGCTPKEYRQIYAANKVFEN